MKVMVLYDSFFGNTEKIAQAVAGAFGVPVEVTAHRVSEVTPEQVQGTDLLILGSPTRAFQPSPATKTFLKTLKGGSLKGMRVAAFDTRMDIEETKSGFLRFMVGLFGYAAQPIANGLKKKGGELAAPPEGFIVKNTEGPLKEGELERASAWASRLIKSLS